MYPFINLQDPSWSARGGGEPFSSERKSPVLQVSVLNPHIVEGFELLPINKHFV